MFQGKEKGRDGGKKESREGGEGKERERGGGEKEREGIKDWFRPPPSLRWYTPLSINNLAL